MAQKESQNQLVKDCHAICKQTMTHAAELESYKLAIASGTDGIQHVQLHGAITKDMIQAILKQKQTVMPTIYIL